MRENAAPDLDSTSAEKIEKMTKKKSATANQPAKRKTNAGKRSKKKIDPAQVREELAGMVKSDAKNIAAAVIDHAKQGELAPAKYLLEMAGVFPATNDGEQATEEEDCLAKTLLDRLNIPHKAADAAVNGAPVEEKAEPIEASEPEFENRDGEAVKPDSATSA